ncbi:MAG: aspartate aminotransferase family protein, partial [Candidatus Levybacteria bacterium]|nr:aspartate aminotransferase family protein [Candidatus Levybacteria bacterium]
MIKNHIIYNDYSDWMFDLAKAQGSYLWTKDGKKLIDFTSGWNVTNLGWNNEEIASALTQQIKKNTYAPMWSSDPIQNALAEALTRSLPRQLNAVGRATGGTEANEEAMKTARAYTGRKKILGFRNTYHGQSFGTMSIGYLPEYVKDISPLVGDFMQIDFPKVFGGNKNPQDILVNFEKELESTLSTNEIAALVTEAGIITGWGSTHIAPASFLTTVRKLTKKYGTLLILDEVGTGFSRCGELYGMLLENIVPDIATFAKGLSNGVAAIGAMVTTEDIANKTISKSNLTSTFGWTPIACAGALKTLEIHLRNKMWEKAKKDGKFLVETLGNEFKGDHRVSNVRGIGMEVGVTFTDPDMMGKVVNKA